MPNGISSSLEKLALITVKERLESGHGILCRTCRFHRRSSAFGLEKCWLPEFFRCRNTLGLVLQQAGNETCADYEAEISVQIDPQSLAW